MKNANETVDGIMNDIREEWQGDARIVASMEARRLINVGEADLLLTTLSECAASHLRQLFRAPTNKLSAAVLRLVKVYLRDRDELASAEAKRPVVGDICETY